MRKWSAAFVLLGTAITGCSVPLDPVSIFCESRIQVGPVELSLRVGELATATATVVSCEADQEHVLAWQALDSSLVVLDRPSGNVITVRAKAQGETLLRVNSTAEPNLVGAIVVRINREE